jgi:hypothetical protein
MLSALGEHPFEQLVVVSEYPGHYTFRQVEYVPTLELTLHQIKKRIGGFGLSPSPLNISSTATFRFLKQEFFSILVVGSPMLNLNSPIGLCLGGRYH